MSALLMTLSPFKVVASLTEHTSEEDTGIPEACSPFGQEAGSPEVGVSPLSGLG